MSTPVAIYNDRQITDEDIAYQLYLLEDDNQEQAVLQYLIVDTIYNRAIDEKYYPEEEAILERLRLLEENGSLDSILSVMSISKDQFRVFLEKDDVVNRWLEDEHDVNEDELEQFYEDRFADMNIPETLHLRHILITIENPNDDEEVKLAKERILEVEQSSLSFENKALKYSECPSAMNGGDLGWSRREKLYPEISKVITEDSKPGDTFIVQTEMGFHFVEFLGKKEESKLSEEEKRNLARKRFNELKNRATVKALADNIKRNLSFM